jgi:hypothetical protein
VDDRPISRVLGRAKAVPHSIEDSLEGCVIIQGRPCFLVYATGIELWSWPPRTRQRFREDEASSVKNQRHVGDDADGRLTTTPSRVSVRL